MRTSFFKIIEERAQADQNVFLLTADLGFKLFDSFKFRYPERFFDIGVAEANMIGVAAGLSLSGKNVYCYSITPFLVMRAYEQIRLDIAYHNLNVKLVGVGGGFTYGLEGFTHFGIEDLSLMRSLPNMSVVAPADRKEAEQLARISLTYPSPLYIRLGRTGEPVIHSGTPDFKIGKGIFLSEGKDVAIFSIGNMVYQSQLAIELLREKGLSPTLVNMHTLKPLDLDLIKDISARHQAIFSVEEHSIHGGLGSALAEVLLQNSYRGRFHIIGIPEKPENLIGTAEYLREKHGLSPRKIADCVLHQLK